MEDDGAGERREHVRGLGVRLAVVDHDGQPALGGELQLSREEPPLLARARIPANGVEARLAHRDDLRVVEEIAELVEASCIRPGGAVRIDPERGEDALVRVGECERRPARLDAGPDRDHACHAGRPGALDERGDRPVARVEVRVRVGHAAAASIRASSSSTTCSASSFTKSGRGSGSRWPGGRRLGSQLPDHSCTRR